MTRRTHVVGIGGGTGLSVLLAGLGRASERARREGGAPLDITAVVSVADDGGSSGRLRREFGIPAVGDLRDCLVALSEGDALWGELFQHRFGGGNGLNGHAVGNLLLADGDPGAVQSTLDGVDADPQDLGHFGGRETFDVAQYQDLALKWIQGVNRSRQCRREFPVGRGLLRIRRRIGEPLGGNGFEGIERVFSRRRELASTAFLDAEPSGDGVQPAGDRGVAPEIPQRTRHGDQALLRHVPGILDVAAHPQAEAIEVRLIPHEQRLERRSVPAARGRQQLLVAW